MKKIYILLTATLFAHVSQAQLHLETIGVAATETFTGFTGAGFQPGGGDGTLNSKNWSATGFSDGEVGIGGTALSGDFARGTTMGLETDGGIYAVDILGNQGLMVQPTADDFTPGSFILMLENSTGVEVGSIDVGYTIYVLNDQGRSNSFNLSFSYDNVSYTDIPDVNYVSPEAADFSPYLEAKATTISGLTIAPGAIFYLRWTGNDVGGSGSRDEFALDDVSVTGNEAVATPLISFNTAAISISETEDIAEFILQASESTDCTMHLSLGAGTASDDDYYYDIPDPLIFTEGEASMAFLEVIILDDLIDEPDETVIVQIDEVTGTCMLGLPGTLTITIIDDEVPAPVEYTVYDIADVTTEDADGIAESMDVKADITGIVYGVNLWDDGLQFTLIDATGGISVFSFADNFGYTVTEGDEINVKGTITQFNGLTEIEPDSLKLISSDNILKTPTSTDGMSEATESDLIDLGAVTILNEAEWLGDGSSFNVTILAEDGLEYEMRIHANTELASMPVIIGEASQIYLKGLGTQYDTDVPYSSGYQVMPRYVSDVLKVPGAIEQADPSAISIYPNPATENLHIEGKENIEWIQIVNQLGETMHVVHVNDMETNLKVQDLPSGYYFLKIKTDTGIYASDFIKQ